MAFYQLSAFADEASSNLDEQLTACKANGILALELRGVDGKNISDFLPKEARALKARLDAAGVTVSAIGSHYGKRPFDLPAFKQTVEAAKILDARYIRVFSFFDGNKQTRLADLRAMVRAAQAQDVLCCHENEKGIFGDTPERCKELLDAVPGLGCVFDFANFLECGADPLDAYQLLKPYITYFHIKDFCKERKQVVPAGCGDGHISAILADFDQYQKAPVWLSLEPHLKSFDGLQDFDAETLRRLEAKSAHKTGGEAFAHAAKNLRKVHAEAQPVALGIIGYGNMGASHAGMHRKGAHKRVRIAAVADVNPDRLAAAQNDLPGVAVFATAEALIASGSCNAVLIATPHYLHPPIAIAALQAGLHVLTEKPAGVYTRQVREMNEAAAAHDRVFAIMYNQRSLPLHQELRKIVRSGRYGALRRVVWVICDWYRTQAYYDSGGWRATWAGEGGGVLLNQCPHQLDLWQWICGMPSKIGAHCHNGKWHDIEVEDDVTIYAEYPNGATGAFITTTGEPAGTNRLEITLDKAKLVCEDGKLTLVELAGSTQEHIQSAAEGFSNLERAAREIALPPLEGTQHAVVLNAFAQAICTGEREVLYAKGEEGINGLTISNAAYLSSWLKKDITLPLDEDLYFAELQKRVAASRKKTNVTNAVASDIEKSFRYKI
ncbi:MAG: Gfo/Idh/MocA family oxidoreductase [Oscillospiraceae bacterium]|jgi:predicted dehydrogenase/sugar phosphate isomerase/epimerase|nr:Gfo/Idh/MocA family oxidoreductase [Oscillospiraceae bacterium]